MNAPPRLFRIDAEVVARLDASLTLARSRQRPFDGPLTHEDLQARRIARTKMHPKTFNNCG
jgi:hypothetical protein